MIALKKWTLLTTFCVAFSFPALSAQAQSFSTWNLEWLSSSPSVKFAASQRSDADYQALKHHFDQMQSNILAFQEVNDPKALTKIIGNNYQLYFSQRRETSNRRHQFEDINQYTGFAVQKGVEVSNQEDLRLDMSDTSKLRFASYIIINPTSNQPIHALSIHLKARCSGRFNSSRDCQTLKQQGHQLNRWISQREDKHQAYVILGDFNHNMSYQHDWLWKDIAQGTKAVLASKSSQAECKVRSRKNPNKTHQFRSLIDHIIVSDALTASIAQQDVYPARDVLKYQLSDHCPLSTTIH